MNSAVCFDEVYSKALRKLQEKLKQKKYKAHNNEKGFINFIKFNVKTSLFISYLPFLALTCFFALMPNIINPNGGIGIITLSMVSLQLVCSIIFILFISSTKSYLTVPNIWQLQAKKIKKQWLADGKGIKKLKKTIRLRVFYYEQIEKFFIACTSVFTLFCTFMKAFTGIEEFKISNTFFYQYGIYVFIFFSFLFLFYFFIHEPLSKLKQIEFCILDDSDFDILKHKSPR